MDYLARRSGVRRVSSTMNFGHAFRLPKGTAIIDGVRSILSITLGEKPLVPREPIHSAFVRHAEQILRVKGKVVYVFAGCLHPDLGTIGLIVSADATRCLLQGATRCDSGGLAGRCGSFSHLPPAEVDDALVTLSTLKSGVRKWIAPFWAEVDNSYRDRRAYVVGEVPDFHSWNDARAVCLGAHDPADWPPDRRLWTWELRLAGSPRARDFLAIVLSHEAFKQLEFLRIAGLTIPSHVKIISGDIGAAGVSYFSDHIVHDLFINNLS